MVWMKFSNTNFIFKLFINILSAVELNENELFGKYKVDYAIIYVFIIIF